MSNENGAENSKFEEDDEDKRRKQVPVEVHTTRSESIYAISEASDESQTS